MLLVLIKGLSFSFVQGCLQGQHNWLQLLQVARVSSYQQDMDISTAVPFNNLSIVNATTAVTLSGLNATTGPERQLFSPAVSWIITALYILISWADFFGNSLVCILSYKEKQMRTQFNMLLLNLSLADIVSGIMMYPYIWLDFTKITQTGKQADFLCAISVGHTLFLTCTLTNMFTLCAITFMRYLNIVKKFRTQFIVSDRFIRAYCVFTWVAGVVIIIPNAWSFKYDAKEKICNREWPNPLYGKIYTLVTTAIGMLLPVATMIYFYIALVKHVWSRSNENAATNIAALRAWKNIAALLGGLIVAYFLCWCPFYTTYIMGRVFQYFPEGTDGEFERQRFLRVAMMFALLNSALDPLIYACRSAEYRKGFRKILGLERRNRSSSSTSDSYLRTSSFFAVSTNNISGHNVMEPKFLPIQPCKSRH